MAVPTLHILSHWGVCLISNCLTNRFIGRAKSFPFFGMWCARRRCGPDWRSRYGQCMGSRPVSFCWWKRPKLGPVTVLAKTYGSAVPLSCSSIDVYLGNGSQTGSSLLWTRKGGEDRTNRMPGFVRQPNRPQSSLPCVKVLHWTKHYTRRLLYIHLPSFVPAVLPSGSICWRWVYRDVGYKPCCRIDWFAAERLHDHDLVIPLWTFSLICMLIRFITMLSVHVCLSLDVIAGIWEERKYL